MSSEEEEDDPLVLLLQPPTILQDLDQYRDYLASNDNSTKFEPAPRTSLIEYNIMLPNELYFVYSPSGGMGNQIVELVNACLISNQLNRTLVVPMLGSHTSMYYAYERLPDSGRFPMDRILDFPHLNQLCRTLPLNISVVDFAANALRERKRMFEIFHRTRRYWKISDLQRALQYERNTPLVYFHGAGMYNYGWTSHEVFDRTFQFVRFSPYLRLRAMEIVKRAFPPDGKFNSMHIRLGDYSRRWPASHNSRARYIAAIPEKFPLRNRNLTMYLATDEPDGSSFEQLRAKNRVLTIRDLPRKLMLDYAEMFPQQFRLDMQGVLDQLVCSQAEDFIPISWSSFSQAINKIRTYRTSLFPEL